MKSDAKRIPDIWYLRLTNDTLYCILSQRMPHLFKNILVFLLFKIPHCYHHYIYIYMNRNVSNTEKFLPNQNWEAYSMVPYTNDPKTLISSHTFL